MLVFFLFSQIFAQSPERGVPLIQNFSPLDYNAFAQNWEVAQDKHGLIYIANNDGVVIYDGVSWSLVETPGSVRAVATNGTTIFAGLRDNPGRLIVNGDGQLEFESLLDYATDELPEIGLIWEVHSIDDVVYFRSPAGLFVFKNEQLNYYEIPDISNSFSVNGKIILKSSREGLYEFREGEFHPLPNRDFFRQNRLATICEMKDGSWLAVTSLNGLYRIQGETITKINGTADELLNNYRVYAAEIIDEKFIAAGTLGGGVAIITLDGDLMHVLDRSTGLRDNMILNTFADREGNIWLAMNDGIAMIQPFNPVTIFGELAGIDGVILGISRFDNTLYVISSVGLFRMEAKQNPAEYATFERLNSETRQYWDILPHPQALFAANAIGLDVITSVGQQTLLYGRSVFALYMFESQPEYVYAGTSEGLFRLIRNSDGSWQADEFKTEPYRVRSLFGDESGNLWLGFDHSGLVRIQLDQNHQIAAVDTFGVENGLPDDWMEITNMNGSIVFHSQSGPYRFHVESNSFSIADESVRDFLSSRGRAYPISEDLNGNLWLSFQHGVERLRPDAENGYQRFPHNIGQIPNFIGYSHFHEEGSSWIGGGGGTLVRYEYDFEHSENYTYQTYVRSVTASEDSLIFDGYPIISNSEQSKIPVLDYSDNRLAIKYAAAWMGGTNLTNYSSRLHPFEKEWSRWTGESQKFYTNIPHGTYTFEVRARNIYAQESEIGRFSVTILPPWYHTWWAYLMYGIGAILLISFVSYTQMQRVRRKGEDKLRKEKERAKIRERELEADAAILRASVAEAQARTIEAENARKTDELEQARKIQSQFLPKVLPEFSYLDFATYHETASEVGGDYYDFFKDGETCYAVVGDATGHGVGAGLMVAATKMGLVSIRDEGKLSDVLIGLNTAMRRLHLGSRLNMALQVIKIQPNSDGSVKAEMVSAGMPPVYIIRANGEVEEIMEVGLPLGLMKSPEYQVRSISLHVNDVLIMQSDGLIERFNEQKEQMGYDRFMDQIKKYAKIYASVMDKSTQSTKSILNLIRNFAVKWSGEEPLDDDNTVVVLKVIKSNEKSLS